ncbi:MAG: MerR family transcriptional regulator [Burkholderiaceae bacterium]|jgi:DNA-binding transcriptional MerR regulator|nr:MerR family transcriptional regulator [Burkholderiaceae bacterium]
MESGLLPIPAKRYFTIGEAADLCGVKPHVLRYWEQEFTQLRPMKRRGNRRYYQHHEVLMIRRIRELLYDQGFTISGARLRLQELAPSGAQHDADSRAADADTAAAYLGAAPDGKVAAPRPQSQPWHDLAFALRRELHAIRDLLTPAAV